MPWHLIKFIVIFAAFLLFIIFNLENRSDVSLGFASFRDVPVFVVAFCSLIAGMLLALPFIAASWLRARKARLAAKKGERKDGARERGDGERQAAQETPSPADLKDYGVD